MATDLPNWHVDAPKIRQVTDLAPGGGGIIRLWEVPYVVDSGPAKGSTHTVRVSGEDFNAAAVEQAIRENLNSVHTVGSLGVRNAVLGQ